MDNASPDIEMGRLLSVLDVLEEYYGSEIDRDVARNNVMDTQTA